jgi:hypothetical protein
MTLRLNGTTSGYTEIDSAAIGNNNLLTLPTTSAGTLIAANSSGVLQMNSGYGSNANAYGCRAWVNFDGTGTYSPNPSTSKIRASGNVSSIFDNGTGSYTVNFTTAMPDANYVCIVNAANLTDAANISNPAGVDRTTSTVRIDVEANSAQFDAARIDVAIFR